MSKDIPIFYGMNKLEKSGHRSQKVVRFKSDIGVQKSQLIEDANIIISHHNQVHSFIHYFIHPFITFILYFYSFIIFITFITIFKFTKIIPKTYRVNQKKFE